MATQPTSDLSRLSHRPTRKRGQNRQSGPRMNLFKIPVNVPPEVAQFRAEYSAHARWLPPHLANVLIGAICTADAYGEDAVTTYEAISAATHTPGLQQRYKCKPVSPRQVERCMPILRELGVLTWHSEKTRVTGWSDHYGEIRARIYLRLTIPNIERLYELAEKARHEKSVRDADRAARRAGYEQARNASRKAERARNTVVACEGTKGINSCPTPNGGSSGGTDGGSSGGRIVPNQSFVTEPSCPSSGPSDDGLGSSSFNQSQSQYQGPAAPRPAGADESSGDEPYEFTPEDREHWAGFLGVPLSSIRESFWTWYGHQVDEMHGKSYEGCECGCDGGPCQGIVSGACTHPNENCPCLCPTSGEWECGCPCPTSSRKQDCRCQCVHDGYWDIAVQAGVEAAKDAAVKQNPVGYFQTILMQKVDLALYRAKSWASARQKEEEAQAKAEAQAAKERQEAAAAQAQRAAEMREQAQWDREQKVIEDRIAEFAYEARQARELADKERAAEEEFNQRLPKYAELHGYRLDAAREASAAWGSAYVCRLKFINSAISLKEMDAERALAKASFLAYVREHATQERPVKVTEVADSLGINFGLALGMANLLVADGLIVQKSYTYYPADPTQAA